MPGQTTLALNASTLYHCRAQRAHGVLTMKTMSVVVRTSMTEDVREVDPTDRRYADSWESRGVPVDKSGTRML